MSGTGSAARRRALLIGINRYTNLPEHCQLDGCCNDVALMRSVLTGKFGFSDGDIRVLLDEQATRDGILTAFDALVNETEQDDVVVIHYAGHGSQMRDREYDEADGMDETIVPYDAGRPPWPNREITDDEIHLRLLRLAERTRNVTLIFDCCHSGTIVRDLSAAKVRQLDPDPRPVATLPPSPLSAQDRALLGDPHSRGPSGWFPPNDRYVLLSGCRDEERSYEYAAGAEDDAVPHGALTWFLAEALMRAVPGTTWRDVYERVCAAVSGANPAQNPQLEGAFDREVFGVRDIEAMRFVAVEERAPGALHATLAGGAAHGLTTGSRWDIHPAGTKVVDSEARLGTVRIARVGAVRSTASVEFEREPGAIARGARAVEAAHDFGELRMTLRLEGEREASPAAWAELEARIGESGLLRLASAPGPRVRVVILPARSSVTSDDPLPQIGPLTEPVLAVVSEAGELMMPPRPAGHVRQVIENLEQWARFRLKLAIRNEGSPLADGVRIELLRRDGDGWTPIEPEAAGGMRVVEVGQTIEIRLTNTTGEPIHAALFDFRPTGEVKRLFPAGSADPLQPGVGMLLGRGRGFIAGWPKGFPFLPNPYVDSPSAGVETLKVFVTTQPTDFAYLEQASASRDRGALPGPLHRLLAAAHGGAGMRDMEPVPPDDWGTAVLPFSLRAPAAAPLEGTRDVEGVAVRAENSIGTIEVLRRRSPAPPGADDLRPVLTRVLDAHGMKPVRMFALATATDPTSGSIEVETPAPPAGWGGLVLSFDAAGAPAWHFARESRSGRLPVRSPSEDRQTFRIGDGADGRMPRASGRGSGRSIVEVLQFPMLDPVYGEVGDGYAARREAVLRPHRIRTFSPDDYHNAGTTVDARQWHALSEGRVLLFIHGAFATCRGAFHSIPRSTLELLHRAYGGRVIAYDHPTASCDPEENAALLLRSLPPDTLLQLDLICHTRGALVGRALAALGDASLDRGRHIRVRRVLLAGSPEMATSHVDLALDAHTAELTSGLLPDDVAAQGLDEIVAVAKQLAVGATGGLDGLRPHHAGGVLDPWPAFPGRTRVLDLDSIGEDTVGTGGVERRMLDWLGQEH